MAQRIRDLTRDWRTGDDRRLAQFFNKTWEAWPGGNEDPKTPKEAARHVRERAWLGVFVTEEEGEFRSFCSLAAKPNDNRRAHVALLTADPNYHGRGYGKAALLAAVARVYEQGIAWIDLYTWPGNMKAVPLYKKSGFMWSPEGHGGVYMQNFTPDARRHPIAQAFFRKHDWYRTLKRDLSLTPDDHKRGKVRVYEYLWEEDGDQLRMVYDRQSWGLLEIETNDFLAGCSLAGEKLVAGRPQQVAWKIVNHRREPLEVVLIANADEGVNLNHREVLTVTGKAELSATFEIDPEIKEKEREPRAALLHSDILVNGVPLRLKAGFQVKQAVSLSLDGDGIGLRRPGWEPLVIQCRNELEEPVKVKLHFMPLGGSVLGTKVATVELPAKGTAEAPLEFIGATPGTRVVSLKVRPEVRLGRMRVKTKEEELYAHVLARGEVAGRVERHRVVLESNTLHVTIWRRGGWLSVTDKLRNRHLASMPAPQAGPPYAWEEFFETPCEARIEQKGDRVTAVLRTSSAYQPGLLLEQRVTVSNLPLVEVGNRLFNLTGKRLDLSLRTGGYFDLRQGLISAPAGGEVVQSPARGAGRLLWEHQLSDQRKDWTEGWIAGEDHDGATAGLLWPEADRVEWGELYHKLGRVEAGDSTPPHLRTYLFAGEGGHFAVRRWWQMLYGARKDREQRPTTPRRPLEFGLQPSPVVIHGPAANAEIFADSVGRLKLDGELAVTPPKGIRITPARVEFTGVCGDHPKRIATRVTRSGVLAEGAYCMDCTACIDRASYRARCPVIVWGDPRRKVTVTEEQAGLFRIANGLLALTLAPRFRGAAISLLRGQEELLYSAYPEARPYSWDNPWAGGIQPHLVGLSSTDMMKQRYTVRMIERRGAQGLLWQGVRVTCSPKEGPRREDRFSIDYLLAPGSAIFAVVVGLAHKANTAGWVGAGFQLFPQLGGSVLDAVLRGSSDPRVQQLRSDFQGEVGHGRWAVAERPAVGEAVLLACGDPEATVNATVFGKEGYTLAGDRSAIHEAREKRESIFYCAYVPPDRARDLAEALTELKELP